MHSDNILLFIGTVVNFILILNLLRINKRLMLINGVIALLYSLSFYYKLFYDSSEGRGLVWWFYHLIFIGLHLIVLILLLILKRKK
jgi:hypothetical protein